MKRRIEGLPYYSLALFVLLGAGYLATLLPGIGHSGDAIKFQYLGKVLGVPHAPGYPLYMALNHLFVTLFPFGSLAYKANLLAAICAVGACFMLFKLLLLLGTGRFVAFVIALTFGFSQAFWSQAIISEVYSLLVFFMALVSYFLVKWHLKRRDRDFYLATALYAFSFGNHLLAITLLPAFVYLVAVTDWKVFITPQKVLWVVSVVMLGALQYLYLFWRLNDPQTPYIEGFNGHNFFYFVTGGPFKPLMFAFTPGQIIENRIPLFLSFMRENMPILGLAVVGAVFARRTLRPVRGFLLIYFLSNAFYAVNYNIPDIDGYFLANDFVLAAFAGLALGRVVRWTRPRTTWTLGFLLLLPVTLYVTNYRTVDQSGNTDRQQGTQAALEAVGQDALIIAPNYPGGQALLYYLIGEGWGEERNLHATYLNWTHNHLRAYFEESRPLPTLGRGGPQTSLPLYIYPCERGRFEQEGFTVLQPAENVPELCELQTAPLNLASHSQLLQKGLFYSNVTRVQEDQRAWRWGLGPQSELYFHLGTPQRLALSIGFSTPFEGQEVTVEANGEVLERFVVTAGRRLDSTLEFSGRAGQNTVTLSYATWNHRETSYFRDERPLAVRFEKLRLEEAGSVNE